MSSLLKAKTEYQLARYTCGKNALKAKLVG